MVKLEQICFSYPGQPQLLHNVSLSFPSGRITTIIGPNGSGKSTLLKVACRLLRPGSGRVMVHGRDIARMKPKELAREIALLGQNHQPLDIPVKDLVAYGRYPHQCGGKKLSAKDREIVHQAMKSTQIEHACECSVSRLSGGQQQRAYIAMAVAQDTNIIFLDEPTTCLDVHISFEIMELVRKLNRSGKTVVMVLHDLSLALEYSDHIILMDGGCVAEQGSPKQIIDSGALDKVFHIQTRVLHEQDKLYYHFERRSSQLR